MVVGTITVAFDLDGDNVYETDVSAYVQDRLSIDGLGASGLSDQATPSRLILILDNRDGRFTPLNTGSPIYPDWHPGSRIRVSTSWNSNNNIPFEGYVSEIAVLPESDDQMVRVTAVDPFMVLASQEIRLPLMVEQLTGAIIDRILDYAERGEMVENDRFNADATGWSIAAGTGTITRSTARGLPLHLPGCGLVENLSQPTGQVRYTLPDNHAGEQVAVAFYVRATTQAEHGTTVRASIRADVGTPTTGSPVTVYFDRWTRATVTGTFDAGASECYATIVRTSSGAVSNFRIGALHVVPLESVFSRGAPLNSVDPGVALIDYIGYARNVNALTALTDVCRNELGGFFHFARHGWYFDRAHRWTNTRSTSSQATFTERLDLEYREVLSDRITSIRFYHASPDAGAAGTIVYTLQPLPMMLRANETARLELDFGGALIRDIISPVAGTDYIANSRDDGTGSDDTGDVDVTFLDFGAGASVTLTNTKSRSTWITLFRVRGTPVRMPTDQLVEVTPVATMPLYNPLVYTYTLQAREAHIRPWANYLSAKYGEVQAPRIIATATAPWPECPTSGAVADQLVAALSLTIGDRITITNTALPFSSKLSGAYWIEGLGRMFGETAMQLRMELVAVDSDYFILGTDELGDVNVGLAP